MLDPPPSGCVGGNPSEKASGNAPPVEAHRQAHTDLLRRRVGMTCPEAGDRELSHGLAERVRLFETLVRRLRPQELVIAIVRRRARVPMHGTSLPHRLRVAPGGGYLGTTPRGGGDASITRSLSSTCFTPLERRAISIARCRSSSDCTLPSRVTSPFMVVTPISVCLSVSSRWYLARTSAVTASSDAAPFAVLGATFN